VTAQVVLIVEDEEKIAGVLRDYLQQAGYATHWLSRGDEVTAWVKESRPDIILLDIMLPGQDGLSVCADIRKFSALPIILLTARVEEIDRVLGLEIGADDYICKPFSGREVVARVKAVLRRGRLDTPEVEGDSGSYRGLHIDVERFAAKLNGALLVLTPVEFRILALLADDPGRVYTRDKMMGCMYPDSRIVSDRTVDSHVKNLRKKLVAASDDAGWIRSIYGIGYRID